jgi:hypothetical protein
MSEEMSEEKGGSKEAYGGAAGGIILIGLGIIFLADIDFWPWILVVLGLSGLPGSVAKDGLWAGMQGAVWMIGVAILFATGTFWPGILILAGLSIIAGAIVQPPAMKSKPKRKRDGQDLLLLPDEDEDEVMDDEPSAVGRSSHQRG